MSVYLQVMGIIMQVMNIACWHEINTIPKLIIWQYGIIYALEYYQLYISPSSLILFLIPIVQMV